MIFSYPDIDTVFDTSIPCINSLIIENQNLFRKIVEDIYNQTEGLKGRALLSSNGIDLIDFHKNAEIFTSIIPFDINRKTLITKIVSAIEKESLSGYNYDKTVQMMTGLEKYLDELTSGFDCNLTYSKITSGTILKSVGIEIVDDYTSLAEKIVDYMELVREFDRDKLFFTVNFRSFINDDETDRFMSTVISHGFNLIMIESREYNKTAHELRRVIDGDLCEI